MTTRRRRASPGPAELRLEEEEEESGGEGGENVAPLTQALTCGAPLGKLREDGFTLPLAC